MTDFQRVELAHVMEETVKAKARERMTEGVNQYTSSPVEKFPQGKAENQKARDELGAMAGVSGKTYEHAAAVIESAPAPIVEAATGRDAVSVASDAPFVRQSIAGSPAADCVLQGFSMVAIRDLIIGVAPASRPENFLRKGLDKLCITVYSCA